MEADGRGHDALRDRRCRQEGAQVGRGEVVQSAYIST